MLDDTPKQKRSFWGWLKDATKIKEKSNSDVTVWRTKSGKEFKRETSHGRFKRFKEEIESGTSKFTGEPLSDKDIGYRQGVVNTMGAQARAWKKKHGN